MTTLKSDTGEDTLGFLGRLAYLFFGLIGGMFFLHKIGIEIPLSDSAGVRLLQILFFGSIGCVAVHAIGAALYGFVRQFSLVLLTSAENGIHAADSFGRKLADLAVSGLTGAAKIAFIPVTWPCRLVYRSAITPWFERRRQEAELRRTYEEVRDRFKDFADFRRAFDGESDAKEEEAAPAPAPADAFAAACETLGLAADGSFTQAQFKASFRALMKEAHPDITGTTASAIKLNQASDLIKSRKGWK